MSESLVVRSFHKNLARLASLVICVEASPKSRSSSINDVARQYMDTLVKGLEVDPRPNEQAKLIKYLTRRALIRKYGVQNAQALLKEINLHNKHIEFQDISLLDPRVPSGMGNERPQSAKKTVKVCQDIGLIAPRTNMVQPLGSSLQILSDRTKTIDKNAPANPFLPNLPLAAASYFAVLQADMVFQNELISALPDENKTFSGYFSNKSVDLLSQVIAKIPLNPATRQTHNWLLKQVRFGQRLVDEGEINSSDGTASIQSRFRPIEDILISRLEILVDISIALKSDRNSLHYRVNPVAKEFLKHHRINHDFLFQYYFQFIAFTNKIPFTMIDQEEIISHLMPAYALLKNQAGYAPIAETVILANGLGFDHTNWSLTEIDSAIRKITDLARTDRGVRTATDRFRKLEGFKIT